MSKNDEEFPQTGKVQAYDFGRRRVQGILNREKPLHEQDDASFNLGVNEMVRMLGIPGNASNICFRSKLNVFANGIKRGHTCNIDVKAACPSVSYWVRKRGPASNTNSRFLPRP